MLRVSISQVVLRSSLTHRFFSSGEVDWRRGLGSGGHDREKEVILSQCSLTVHGQLFVIARHCIVLC